MNVTRPPEMRIRATARWKANMDEGDWHFNTHHQTYQFCMPGTMRFMSFPPQLIEMNDAQFELNLARLREARKMARE